MTIKLPKLGAIAGTPICDCGEMMDCHNSHYDPMLQVKVEHWGCPKCKKERTTYGPK